MVLGLHFVSVFHYAPQLWRGFQLTVFLTVAGVVLGGGTGLAFAIWEFMVPPHRRWLSWPVRVYVEAIRNTPLLVQLYFIFFGLPSAGIHLNPIEASVLGISLNLGAYATEIYRAGFNSVKRPQIEAGMSLALTRLQVMRHVVLVPGVARVWPSLVSQFLLMMLGTSLCSFISLEEISGTAFTIQSTTFLNIEVYIVIAVLYLLITVALKASLGLLGKTMFSRVLPAQAVRATIAKPNQARKAGG